MLPHSRKRGKGEMPMHPRLLSVMAPARRNGHGPLARLQLDRAFFSSDKAKAKPAYRDFLALSKDADPDIPMLKRTTPCRYERRARPRRKEDPLFARRVVRLLVGVGAADKDLAAVREGDVTTIGARRAVLRLITVGDDLRAHRQRVFGEASAN